MKERLLGTGYWVLGEPDRIAEQDGRVRQEC